MARRKRKKHVSLLDDKPVSNIKKEEKREPGLLTKEEIEELHKRCVKDVRLLI